MKISDLIQELSEIMESSGDVEVEVAVMSSPTDYRRGNAVAACDHYDGVSCAIMALGEQSGG